MTRPTALIAEDESPQRAQLRRFLQELWPELDVVAECADGDAAMAALSARAAAGRPPCQVAFLDIRMPGASGLEVARAAGADTHIVFVTAYDDFAVQAFEDGAVDYLLKPIRRERLAAAVERIRSRMAAGARLDIEALLGRLVSQDKERQHLRWLTATSAGAVRMLAVEDVLFFQAQDKYTRVVTVDDEVHIRTPLKELAEQLDPDVFWQIHRSAIVRPAAVRLAKRDDDGKLQLHLQGRVETLPVSPRYAWRFRGM